MSNQKTQNFATLTETVFFFLQNRLRLVPLSLSLSCVTRNKTWGHKTLERRESRKRKRPRIKLSGFVSWSLTLRASCMPPRFRAVIFSPRFMYTVPMDVLIVLTQTCDCIKLITAQTYVSHPAFASFPIRGNFVHKVLQLKVICYIFIAIIIP